MSLKRIGRLIRTAFIIWAIWFAFQIATHLWWTGETYCWGDAVKCVIL